ncbi:hypothetical protein G7047_24710 [Diaphorobacter sp. HDW4A]|uniref:hypothetical protein n=1 Tax=Diaphorobacter sp. HDW4A TaxID=2714924 RepID=UPI00140AE364|nr:hypothetical protein [Diaphorobacter sp. HDW4A]QIL82782.1 hypothetical protein G7047_24710 [Diaphorobacter sp. HDW4A]
MRSRCAAWLEWFATGGNGALWWARSCWLLALCIGTGAGHAAQKDVLVVGKTQVCFSRDYALELAAISAENNAHDACAALGSGWRLGELRIPGYQQCRQCGQSKEYRCEITQVSYSCISTEGRQAAEEKAPRDGKSGSDASSGAGAGALEKWAKPANGADAASPGATQTRNPLEHFEAERAEVRKQPIRITSPQPRQQVTTRVVEVVGDTQGVLRNSELTVHFNGAQQRIASDANGKFQVRLILAAGLNNVRVCHAQACSEVAIDAKIQPQALMATLTWQGRADLDLHVLTPSGAHCMHGRRSIANECSLDIDDTRGVNPENISIAPQAPKGKYRFSVVNYSGQSGIQGVLSIYKAERLVETRPFVTGGGKKSTALEVDVGND